MVGWLVGVDNKKQEENNKKKMFPVRAFFRGINTRGSLL